MNASTRRGRKADAANGAAERAALIGHLGDPGRAAVHLGLDRQLVDALVGRRADQDGIVGVRTARGRPNRHEFRFGVELDGAQPIERHQGGDAGEKVELAFRTHRQGQRRGDLPLVGRCHVGLCRRCQPGQRPDAAGDSVALDLLRLAGGIDHLQMARRDGWGRVVGRVAEQGEAAEQNEESEEMPGLVHDRSVPCALRAAPAGMFGGGAASSKCESRGFLLDRPYPATVKVVGRFLQFLSCVSLTRRT